MKRLFSCLLLVALVGCVSGPRHPSTFTVEGAGSSAALKSYQACIHRAGAALKGALTETARDIAATAVGSCEAELLALRSIVKEENGGNGYAPMFADEYAKKIRTKMLNDYATLVMRERSR